MYIIHTLEKFLNDKLLHVLYYIHAAIYRLEIFLYFRYFVFIICFIYL